ncbi:MAG: LamG domain-containing protein [Saprospiraceae bacterium]|nr:LamG domain-containing protein [Saprospiraceae bacterium]
MSHALAPFSPGLIAYYKFDGNIPCMAGGSTTLFDSGPNVFEMAGSPFNGTLRSFALDNNCVSNWSEGRNADINKDGLGDICSLNAGLSQDSDNDGYSDLVDLCPNTQDAALHFDGTNWAESVNDANIVGNGSFSLSAWIYPTSDDFSTIISQGNGGNAQTNFILTKIKGDGTAFPLKDHNKIGLYLANGTTAEWKLSTTRVTLNKWTHVAVSISGNTVTFYINGEFDGKQMFSFSNYYAGTGHLYIGRQGEVCNCNYFKGRLDDISIWNKSLNKEEVKSLFAKKFMGNEPNLVAGYNFNNQGVPCQSNGGIDFVIDISGKVTLNLWNFDLTNNNCERNWTKARNQDSDNNGIGDACETSTFACASMAGTGGPGTDNDYFEDCLDFCPLSTETGLQFDGINDFVYVDDNPQLFFPLNLADGDFTLELWVKPGETTQNVPLINKGHGLDNTTVYNLVIIGDQVPQLKHKLGLNMSGEWVFSNSSMKANEWTHIAVTFEYVPKTIRFYINGQLDSQPRILSTNSLYNSDSGRLTLGNDRSGASSKYVGTMEDVIIWDKILSNEQILQTMAAPLQGSESNLVAYYKFDDGVPYGFNSLPIANTLIDSGPNTLNGVLQDFDLVGTVSNWAPGRNNDSDGDGMGDGCDDGSPCPPNYAGMNALDNTLQFSNDYKTNGVIESSQMIYNPINLIYNSATSVNLLPGFQLNKQAVMTVKNDGCNQN